MRSRATVQSPAAWAKARGGQRYKITAEEIAAGLTDADISFGFDPGFVERYGADPTGVADSLAAFLAACSTGHPVQSAGGTFRLTGPLQARHYLNINLHGAVLLIDYNGGLIENSTGTSVLYMDLRGFTIRANDVITASALGLVDVSRSRFADIVVDRAGVGDGFAYGIRMIGVNSACYWNKFFNVELTAVLSGGFRIDNGSNDNFFYDCRLINHISGYVLPVGLWITNGVNNCFFGLSLEAIWEDTTPGNAYAVRLDIDADCNYIAGLRTEGHTGSTAAYAVYWNGGTSNGIYGHRLLGLGTHQGDPDGNAWHGISTVGGASSSYAGGTQFNLPANAGNPSVDNGAVKYNTSTGKLMAVIGGAAAELSPTTEGTYLATLTGIAETVQETVRWVKHGNVVTLYIPSCSGTSNSSGMTLDNANVPAAILPARTQRVGGVLVQDAAGVSLGTVNVGVSGTLTFGYGPAEGSFTDSGVKGVFSNTVSYLLT